MAGRQARLRAEASKLATQRNTGKALDEFFTRLIREHPDDATVAASLKDSALREAFAVLLVRAQERGTVRPDLTIDDLISMTIGAVAALKQADNAAARERAVTAFRDVLHLRQAKRPAKRR